MADPVDGGMAGQVAGATPPAPRRPATSPDDRAERLAAARRRAGAAKGLIGVVAALVFGAAAVFARQSYPGHPKGTAAPLGAPRRFVDVVRQDQLQGGVVGPPQAPPGASTSVS
jgi:hypothetical protein